MEATDAGVRNRGVNQTNYSEYIEAFIEQHKNMIYSVARKRLGAGKFSNDEAVSCATLACYDILLGKRDQTQRAKAESVFYFYLNKRLDDLVTLGVTEVGENNPCNIDGDESRIADWDFASADDSCSCDTHGFEDTHGSSHEPSNFSVCLESLFDRQASKELIDAIRYLTNRATDNSLSDLMQRYNIKKPSALKTRLRKIIKRDLLNKGNAVYRAECLNGSHRVVIVCARNESDAKSYLNRYGAVLSCREVRLV